MKNKLLLLLFSLPFFVNPAKAQCSASVMPLSTHGCTYEYFTNISASGTGVTSTIAVSGIPGCTGYWFPDYSGTWAMGINAAPGSTVTMNLTRLYNPGYTAYVSVWIDWNNNDIFESTELCGTQTTWPAGSSLVDSVMTYPFVVPVSGAVTGTHLHMRLFMWDNTGSPPCSMAYGTAYDFWFMIGCAPPVVGVSPTSGAVCIGGGIVLTGSGAGAGGTYTWAPSGGLSATTGVSVTASPTVTTVYTVTGTATTGCFNTATTTVTVNPPPSPISGTAQVCQGSTTTLSDISGSGTWSSGNPAVATVVASSGLVTGVSSGTALVTFTLSSTGCHTTIPVTVNPLPPTITGAARVCPGFTTLLSNSASGGAWSSSNSSVASVATTSGLVSGIAPGTAGITYTLGTGCLTETTVTVNPLPAAITGMTAICVGFTSVLGDGSTGGTWGTSNASVVAPGFFRGLFIGYSAGTATITYTLSTGCYATTSFTVNPGPAPITGTPRICTGLNTTLADATPGGTWLSSNTGVATIGTSGNVSGISPGTSTISYSPSAGCPAIITVTVFPVPGAITGPASVCAASSITLSDPVSGGIWSSPGYTGAVSVGTYSGAVTGISAGTAVITYTLAAGCVTSSTITVNPLPGNISGTNHLCAGQSAILNDGTLDGVWNGSGASVSVNPSSGLVSAVSAGTSMISYVLPTGCLTTFSFTVNPLPAAILGIPMVCAGSSVTLADSSGGGTWTSPGMSGIASIGFSSGIATGVSAGTLTITYTLATGCNTTLPFTVNPLPQPITGTMHVCQGQTTTLADATGGGSWSTLGPRVTVGGTTGVVAGVLTGTAIVTYSTPAGCIATSTVTVNPAPLPVTGAPNVCVGYSITLTDTTSGGTWVSSTTAIATVGSSSGILSGVSVGTTIITYTAATGCSTTTTELVNPLPGPVLGLNQVCQLSSVSLSDVVSGGTWTSGSTIASIGSSTGVLTGISAGTASITYFLGTGCISSTIVTVNPLPSPITGNTNVCIGYSTNLSSSTTGGSWSDAGFTGVATVGTSGSVTSVSVGSAIVTYILTTGCYTTTTVDVNSLPGPITGTRNVCERASTTLADSTSGGTWSSAGTGFATVDSTSGAVTGVLTGTTIITYTSPVNCIATAVVYVILSPSLITGPGSVCSGSSIALADSTTEGTWSSAATGVGTIGTAGIVTGISGGVAPITYTINTGCYSIVTVTVDQLPSAISGTQGFCMDTMVVLSDSVSGGAWSSSNILVASVVSSGRVSGIAAGSAIITYSTGAGCNAMVTVTVMPLIAPVAGRDSVCKGSLINLTDATPGGVWTSGNLSVASVGSSGVVTGISPGTAAVTYSVLNSCGTGVAIIRVNPLPNSGTISGNTKACTGNSTMLTDAAPGGIWSVSAPGVGNINASGKLTGVATGLDTVYYSVTNVCGTAVSRFVVTVGQTPPGVHIVTYPSSYLCTNTFFQNFATSSGEPAGTTFIWSAVNAIVYATSPDKQNCLVNFNSPGAGWVILSSGTTGTDCFASDSVGFNISVAQSPNPTVVYAAPELICNDNTASSYQWGYDDAVTLDSTLIPGAINENYELMNPDFLNKYYWVMTDHGGCIQKSYYNQPAQISSVNSEAVKMILFPNPAGSAINIELSGTSKTDKINVRVYSLTGSLLIASNFEGNSGAIWLPSLAAGTYELIAYRDGAKIGASIFIKN